MYDIISYHNDTIILLYDNIVSYYIVLYHII